MDLFKTKILYCISTNCESGWHLEVADWQLADAHVSKLHHLKNCNSYIVHFHHLSGSGRIKSCIANHKHNIALMIDLTLYHTGVRLLLDNLVLLLQGLLLNVLLVAVLQPLCRWQWSISSVDVVAKVIIWWEFRTTVYLYRIDVSQESLSCLEKRLKF